MSLEYSMFRFSDDYPTAEGLSEMIMQVAMNESGGEMEGEVLRRLVDAAWHLRTIEATEEAGDDEEVDIPSVREPGYLFMDKYAAACKAIGEPCNDGDAWWEDWWPTNCLWHPGDIAHLARLKAGETQAVRRQLRRMLADKGACDETGVA
ncbi:hypothetical protein EBZ80_24585 [bacterium]|nr:hypothetical protein [bacterium]